MPTVPSYAVAFGETESALRRYRQRARGWLGLGLGLSTAGLAVGPAAGIAEGGWAATVAAWGLGTGLVVLVIGTGSVLTARRMREALSAGPWAAWAALDIPPGAGAPRLVVRDPDAEELRAFTPVVMWQRHHVAVPGPTGVLWWCGDPLRGGVIAQPGGGTLVWVRPTRTRRRRMRDIRGAEASGLLRRPAPAQPQPSHSGLPAAHPRTGPPRRRRMPVFRWIALLGAVLTGLGFAWSTAADRDPQIELTVRSEDRQGNCTVTWRDPDSGRLREGPFRCDPGRDPILSDWATGWVVSYGPWKGDLYNADLEGTPANAVNDALLLSGLLIFGGSAAAGGIRTARRLAGRHRARRLAAQASTGPEPSPTPLPTGVDLSYAAACEAAQRTARPRTRISGRRREADVRTAPWWRVRTLLRMSQLTDVLLGTVGALAPLLYWRLVDDGEFHPLMLAALGGVGAVVAGHRARTQGLPAVRELVRAAQAPVPVLRSYALLPDPHDATPVLVFFPAGAGPDAMPVAILAVCPPGPRRRPWAGLPAPVGTADLRGWLNKDPTVVPWIDGRPLWPLHSLREVHIDTPEDREDVALLLGGQPAPRR
ncbi:hypothetical protein [Streptomyces boncukensis]|uniref:Uncharacterized protein n=1 Tax=Streptomyces boncukensis TaxID=2711219 RepID=A0A6G4X560_9ACTN|nr:hypothetical protein [Streptomyces boncukensis]NGO72676.1 hypothetical protein [Streptomyces boncukensis]